MKVDLKTKSIVTKKEEKSKEDKEKKESKDTKQIRIIIKQKLKKVGKIYGN